MHTVRIWDCFVYFQSFFPKAVPFSAQGFESLSLRLLDSFASDNLGASDISLEKGDELFSYKFKARLFNDLITFTVDSTHVEASFKNIRRSGDREIVLRCIDRLIVVLEHLETKVGWLNVSLHAGMESEEIRNDYLKGFGRPEAGFAMGGGLIYKTESEYGKFIRLEVDQSYTYPQAVFIEWRVSELSIPRMFAKTGVIPGLEIPGLDAKSDVWDDLFHLAEIFDLKIATDEQPA